MSRVRVVVGLILVVLLAACSPPEEVSPPATEPLEQITANDLQIVSGQTVFVPAYSEIFSGTADRTTRLTVTLAIHNTDAEHPIIIESVAFYNTEGQLVRNFVEEPLVLNPLATTGFVVEDADNSGGFGANFVVNWIAETLVFEPVVEAIMINTSNQQGLSFITTGRILDQIDPDEADSAE